MAVTTYHSAFLVALLLASRSFAAPPTNVAPDPELKKWFEALRQPLTGRPCCAVSDCRFVVFTIRDGHYEVEIEGWRYVVPDGVVIRGAVNLPGRAVACYTISEFGMPLRPGQPRDKPQDTIEMLCFVPPRPPS